MNDPAVALLDLDGTVADYEGAAKREMDTLRSPDEPQMTYVRDEEPQWLKARRALVTRQPGFWRNLPLLSLGYAIYGALDELGFSIHVLTKGPSSKTKSRAWTEKVDWCRTHLPRAKITITEEKSLMYGRVLVDDWPEYFLPWAEHRPRGLVLVPAQPWNIRPPNYFGGNVVRVKSPEWRKQLLGEDATRPDVVPLLKAARDRKPGEPLVLP